MERPLNSDQLGKKGEHRFPELCVDDGLIANPSSWDRKGWDFVVDWPFEPSADGYDKRPSPLSCLVQVKTVWDDTDAIKVTLSAIEHLAKDVKPAFIAALRVQADLSFAEARLAHVDGNLLAHILKALRKAQVDGAKLNDVEMSLSLNKWFKPLPGEKGDLRSALESAIGPSVGDYIQRKQAALRDLGFEQGHMTLQTTLQAESMDAITDAFLGLAPIEAIGISAAETRFGIALPIPDMTHASATLKFSPRPHDTCKITVRLPDGKSVSFKGEMYGVPREIKVDHVKLRIASELFSFVLRADEVKVGGLANFTLDLTIERDNIRKAKLPGRDWAAFYSFMDGLARERLPIEIKPLKSKVAALSGQIELNRLEGHDENEYAYAARITAAAADMFKRANWPGAKLRIEEIGDAGRPLFALQRLVEKPEELSPLSFATPAAAATDGQELEMLYFNYVLFGQQVLAYAASSIVTARIEDGLAHWKGGALTFRDVVRIQARPGDFKKFMAKIERITGIQNQFAPNFAALLGTNKPENND